MESKRARCAGSRAGTETACPGCAGTVESGLCRLVPAHSGVLAHRARSAETRRCKFGAIKTASWRLVTSSARPPRFARLCASLQASFAQVRRRFRSRAPPDAGAGGESGRGRAPTPDFRTQRLVGTPLSEEHQSGLPLRPLYGWVYLLIACPASAIIIVLEPTLYYCILGNW